MNLCCFVDYIDVSQKHN